VRATCGANCNRCRRHLIYLIASNIAPGAGPPDPKVAV
jgi:hypothetical protein